jgi:ectoine hydroxylase-related dioxygenase (phytanoyl-CoA dioxygenase family)
MDIIRLNVNGTVDTLKEDCTRISDAVRSEGAAVIGNLVSPRLTAALKQGLQNALAEDESRRGPSYVFRGMVHALMTRGNVFLELLELPAIRRVMQNLLGYGCTIHAYNSSSMPPAGTNFSRSIHVDCPRLIPGYITNVGLTIALDPFTSENGAMEIAADLRHLEAAPSEDVFSDHRTVLDFLQPGDAVIFNARCWHRGGINRTVEWRHAVTMNVARSFMKQQFDFPRMFSAETAATFSDDLKQFLGYFVRSPVSLDEFLLPADQRLYRPGQE